MKTLLFFCALSVFLDCYSADTGTQQIQKMPINLKICKQPSEQNARLSQYEWKEVSDKDGSVYWQGVLKAEHQKNALPLVTLSRRMSFGDYSK